MANTAAPAARKYKRYSHVQLLLILLFFILIPIPQAFYAGGISKQISDLL